MSSYLERLVEERNTLASSSNEPRVRNLLRWPAKSPAVRSKAPPLNGIQEGITKKYYKSGTINLEINFKNGKQDGIVKEYYENGKLKQEGNYKNEKAEGILKYYSENGKLKQETQYILRVQESWS